MRRLLSGAVVVLAVVFTCSAAWPSSRSIASGPDRTWVTDGPVFAFARLGDTVYIGGRFSQFGPRTGPGVGIDAVTGQVEPDQPEVSGSGDAGDVLAAEPDGSGGWFIGGSFTAPLTYQELTALVM